MIKVKQSKWTQDEGWKQIGNNNIVIEPQIVLVFGGSRLVSDPNRFNEIKSQYPNAHIVSCSTAGEIVDTVVSDDSMVLTAVAFDKIVLDFGVVDIDQSEESFSKGQELAGRISSEGLVHAMVFSDGLRVNGTALVNGLISKLSSDIAITGGLVGDGSDFKHTYVGLDSVAQEGRIVLVGFYGSGLKVGYGSLGGWDAFGPERQITKSKGNVLYELDGESALALYKNYLGDQARGLPGTGLLFPLNLRIKSKEGEDIEVVRTLLAVDEPTGAMTFVGDMPTGVYTKLMKANFERLVDGAEGAATLSLKYLNTEPPELAILISCIGRKLVLRERIEEEIEAVREILGARAAICGFYSYGELCPTSATDNQCQLHNQTMTITVFKEE